jgi:hypothetical protein
VLVARRVTVAGTLVKVRTWVDEMVFTRVTVIVFGSGLLRILQAASIALYLYPRRYGGYLTSRTRTGLVVTVGPKFTVEVIVVTVDSVVVVVSVVYPVEVEGSAVIVASSTAVIVESAEAVNKVLSVAVTVVDSVEITAPELS